MTGRTLSVGVLLAALAPAAGAAAQTRLTLKEAEQRALDGHPQIRAGEYHALAAGEVARQAKSAYFPTVFANLTGAGAQDGTRVTAGALNNPTILDRVAAGFAASQLLTDFGRTSNLVQGDLLQADVQRRNADADRADVLLGVDRAYFAALGARAVLRVAQQTVEARRVVADQIEALAASNLKSSLDVTFARVNLSQAELLLVQAQNDVQASDAALTAALGSAQAASYDLQEEPLPSPPPDDAAPLVAQALSDRPELAAKRAAEQAAARFVAAERALWFPSVSLVGAAGFTPYHEVGLTDKYSALGVNISVPVTNGNLYAARRAEAAFRAQAEAEGLRDLENRITRDVTIAWLDARTAYQKLDLTSQLLAQASDALELAQARYDLGLSSIVELSQAQLNKTEAEIEQARARYEFQTKSAVLKYQIGALR